MYLPEKFINFLNNNVYFSIGFRISLVVLKRRNFVVTVVFLNKNKKLCLVFLFFAQLNIKQWS